MLFISFAIVLADSIVGVNVHALIMLIVIGSFFSLVTPAAIAFLFSQNDLIKAKDFMMHVLITCIFLVVITVTALYAYANVIF